MRLAIVALLFMLAGFAVACSSGGSGVVQKDVYGNISGHWQLVVESDGSTSYIWVAFAKPGWVYIDARGFMYQGGVEIGKITNDSAEFFALGADHPYLARRISETVILLSPSEPDAPVLWLIVADAPE